MVCPPTDSADLHDQIAAALQGLPALERRVVELHHYQQKTISQAARELGICRPWTSRLHARALVALRTALDGSSLPLPPERRNARAAHDRHTKTIGEGVAR
jgi:DNA-directed RNA polymerase specialized sigma24 family protein